MTLTEKEQAKQEIDPVLTEAAAGNKEMREALEVTEEARQRDWLKQTFAGSLFMGDFNPRVPCSRSWQAPSRKYTPQEK